MMPAMKCGVRRCERPSLVMSGSLLAEIRRREEKRGSIAHRRENLILAERDRRRRGCDGVIRPEAISLATRLPRSGVKATDLARNVGHHDCAVDQLRLADDPESRNGELPKDLIR